MLLYDVYWEKMVTLASDEEEFFTPNQLQQHQSAFDCLERVDGEKKISHESVARQQLNETKA